MAHNTISLFLAVHICCLVFWSLYHCQLTSGLTETEALLRWKQSLPYQPILDSWVSPPQANSSASQIPCSWRGIRCDSSGSVVELNLNNTGLKARFLKADSSIWTTFAGTYGYAAPELAYTMAVTEKVDVYSFGVLAIEVLMGEHPGELISNNQTSGMNQINFKEILDPRLSSTNQQNLKKLALIWHLALPCLQANPQSRPTMRSVAQLMEMEMENALET